MEELQPQELEELVQELERENGAEESLSPEVEALLRNLQPARLYTSRRRAAKQLGEVSRSNRQIVWALVETADTESSAEVRAAATESLRAPVHQEYLRQHPDLMEEVERVLREAAGSESRVPTVEAEAERILV
jgi:hypothetical protein